MCSAGAGIGQGTSGRPPWPTHREPSGIPPQLFLLHTPHTGSLCEYEAVLTVSTTLNPNMCNSILSLHHAKQAVAHIESPDQIRLAKALKIACHATP